MKYSLESTLNRFYKEWPTSMSTTLYIETLKVCVCVCVCVCVHVCACVRAT